MFSERLLSVVIGFPETDYNIKIYVCQVYGLKKNRHTIRLMMMCVIYIETITLACFKTLLEACCFVYVYSYIQ